MTKTYRLATIEHAVQIGTTLTRSWFRGHATIVGQLTPRFHRRYGNPFIQTLRQDMEMELIEAFKRDVRAIAPTQLPDEDDTLGWLYLMQHYHAPTRLLDWTENALAGLFFALGRPGSGEFKKDGELWAMLPWALNREAVGVYGIPLLGERSAVLAFLTREIYHNNRVALARAIADEYASVLKKWREDPRPFDRPVAFEPRRDFPRMLVQSSVFTIHPHPTAGNTITEILHDERELVRYIVPARSKEKLWADLRSLGITDRTLFPDFEGLSRTIAPPHRIEVGYAPPQPPECEGLVEVENGARAGQASASEPGEGLS